MKPGFTLRILIFVSIFTGFFSQTIASGANVVGMWLFDEGQGNQVADASGNGHNGVAVDGDLEWGEGKFGKALKFGKDSARVHVEHDDAFNLETFTIVCWVKIESANGDWQTVVAKRSEGATDTNYVIEIQKTNDIPRAAIASGGVWKAGTVSAVTVVTDMNWHHLATTYDAKEFKFYVDGELEGTEPLTLNPDTSIAPLSIGADSYASKPVLGLIDEVAIFNVALSHDDIKENMKGLKPANVEPQGKLSSTWANVKAK